MKNSFMDLVPGDVLYICRAEISEVYDKVVVTSVHADTIVVSNYYKGFKRENVTRTTIRHQYSSSSIFYLFMYEEEAIRYAKSQVIKELRAKIKAAEEAFDAVKAFRTKFYEELNVSWVDSRINKMKQERKEHGI